MSVLSYDRRSDGDASLVALAWLPPDSGWIIGTRQGLPRDEKVVASGWPVLFVFSFWVLVIVNPMRVLSALKPTSVTGPRPRLILPPQSHDGVASPNSYLLWKPRACRSWSAISG